MGFLLHYVYLTTRCLWLPMLLHFLNNAGAAVLSNKEVLRRMAFAGGPDAKLEPNLAFCSAVFFLLALVAWARTRCAPD